MHCLLNEIMVLRKKQNDINLTIPPDRIKHNMLVTSDRQVKSTLIQQGLHAINIQNMIQRLRFLKRVCFRRSHSTFIALVILLENITTALDNTEFAVCMLIDFSKAFDTVEHSILLDKLYHYGIRGIALHWFNSYLTNRYQYVKYNNTPSDMKKITCGVPQGSILGPLLFLLYIKDIASVSNILSLIVFADDTTLFCSSKNLQALTAIVNNEFSNIMQWLNAIDKTNFMLFRPKGCNEICPSIHICGANIIEVDSAKFLGIVIDNRLNWVEHVKCIARKIAKGIDIIIKARKSFESETLLNLYNALIFPYISYGIHVLNSSCSSFT